MTDHADFAWVLLVLGLVLAGVGMNSNLAPVDPLAGPITGRYSDGVDRTIASWSRRAAGCHYPKKNKSSPFSFVVAPLGLPIAETFGKPIDEAMETPLRG
jgi:hypothetical protein